LSSVADSAVPLSMPPPRQTKTLAAMREKMRAKRMLKEAERNPSGSGFYSLPGSMTPHPASGACGYFHQPTGYPSSSNGFGSPLLPSVGYATRSQAAVGQAVSLTTQLSASAAVTKFLVGSSQNRPSTTTRAFFVDGDNLSEAVALLQSLNPKATITQQQFLLIPSSNKSQMFLCPTPSTSTPNILSVPVSTSAPSSTTQTNGTSAPLPSATQVSLSAKNSPNQTVVPTANFSGIRQLSVSSLNAMSNQVAANQLVPNATTSVTGLDSAHSLHSKAANVVLPTMGNNPITSSNTQGSRSLICTKSVPSYPQPATPNVVHLKPQTKPVIDHVPDRSLNKATVVVPRRTVAPVSKPLTETVYATPVTQSQIAFSLIAPGSSVLNSETPVMFVSETHPNTYSRQLNLSAVQSSVASLDRSQTLVSSIGTVGPASIAPNAGPAHTAASAQMTVINPAQLTSCDLHLQPQTQQRIHSVPTQLHCASSVAPEQTVQAVRATSISYASNIGPGLFDPF
uniref:BRCA2-interacting transcriptional repressor EMSY n=1 Tax=Echinostoma caproni TaxID=27848 RepID=A0A183B047_9TREM